MELAEKISLIRDICAKMENWEWPEIDLVLEYYELPTYNSWDGSRSSYIFECIKRAPEPALFGIAKTTGLTIDMPVSNPVAENRCWEDTQFRLFLSHISADKVKANNLKLALAHYGICLFVAHEDIEPTREWMSEIECALQSMDALAALISDEFHASNWTDQEVGTAIGRGLLIIPLKINKDPYGFMGKYQAINIKDKPENYIAEKIYSALIRHEKFKKKMMYALVSVFETSYSFQRTKDVMTLMEQSEYLDEALATRIKNAIRNNSQIKNCYKIEERVAYLLAKFNLK